LRFLGIGNGEVFARDSRVGMGGGGRGARNLSAGTMVFTSTFVTELIEALRSRGGRTSTGTQSRFTGWPGRYGQVVVEGSEGSWISVPSSSSYLYQGQPTGSRCET
jgi:hypothetical protein